jgi:hypothetical protein
MGDYMGRGIQDGRRVRNSHGKRLQDPGTGGPGRTISIQFSPDGRYLATCDRIWAIAESVPGDQTGTGVLQTKVLKRQKGGFSLVCSPDNRHVAFCNNAVLLWDWTQKLHLVA